MSNFPSLFLADDFCLLPAPSLMEYFRFTTTLETHECLWPHLCVNICLHLLFTFIMLSLPIFSLFYYVFQRACLVIFMALSVSFSRFLCRFLMALSPVISFAKYCQQRREEKEKGKERVGKGRHVLAFNKYFKCCVVFFLFSRPLRRGYF